VIWQAIFADGEGFNEFPAEFPAGREIPSRCWGLTRPMAELAIRRRRRRVHRRERRWPRRPLTKARKAKISEMNWSGGMTAPDIKRAALLGAFEAAGVDEWQVAPF
jgi:hypothetical protein